MGDPRRVPPAPPVSGAGDGERYRDIDRAAILGATLAVILALTLPPGAWGWLALFTGFALSAIVLSFFRIPRSAPGRRVRSAPWGQLMAHASVVALCLGLAVAWPWQEYVWQHSRPVNDKCRHDAQMAARAAGVAFDAQLSVITPPKPGEMRDSNPAEVRAWVVGAAENGTTENCKGDAATEQLWKPMLVFFGATFLVDSLLSRRRPQPGPPSAAMWSDGLWATSNRNRARWLPIRAIRRPTRGGKAGTTSG